MTTLFKDTFTDTSGVLLTAHTPDVGAYSWTNLIGTMSINASGKATSSNNSDSAAVVNVGVSDCVITDSWAYANSFYSRNYFRVTNSTNYLRVDWGGSAVRLLKIVNGTTTTIATSANITFINPIKITLNGSSITINVNNVDIITVTETFNQTATQHGISSFDNATTHDNFQIDSLAAGGPLTGSATLQGVGTLTASGTMTQTGSASLQGVGTFSASGTVILSGSANLQGVGTLGASGTLIVSGSASLQGVGTLSASGSGTSPNPTGSASLQGVGTLIASGVMTITGGASLQGVGTLQASGGFPISGSASLIGVGTITASGLNIKPVEILRTVNLQGDWITTKALQGEFIASVSLLGEMINKVALEGEI